MGTDKKVLHLTVGEPMAASLERARTAMLAARENTPALPYFGIGFDDVGELFAIFTPKRWELIGTLRSHGPMTIAELARTLGRDYKNVHNDCDRLTEWLALEKDETGRICAPYDEIVVDMKLPERVAA
ncbi:MAG: hypothetical protein PHH47_06965 [Gallionella sp.]|nr:hypothetical protein [Gallionella sp.]MDD4946668.1 hypothetical protein [Gallionella sp.]MDD5613083.1 hypothetical protein [Gallionella sp.]